MAATVPSRKTITAARNQSVCQNHGCTVIDRTAPVLFQTPSSLQAVT